MKRFLYRIMVLMFAVSCNSVPINAVLIADEAPVSFHRQVMPLLRIHCVGCHKPGKQGGGLDLTTHRGLLNGGETGSSIRPGEADASPLVKVVCGKPPEMPKDGEPLLPQEIDLLRRWVVEGAAEDEPMSFLTRRPSEPLIYTSLPSVRAIAFSPDGNLLAVPARHEILLHRADGSGIVARLLGDSPRLETLTFSRDGSLLVASGGAASEFGEIQIWDTAKRELVRSIKGSTDTFYGVAISHDNRLVAVGCADKLVRVFNVADGDEVMRCDNHLDWVFGSAFTNDGTRLATISRDKAAKLIDVSTGHLIDDINQTRDPLICMARHPIDDLIATGGTEGKIRLFRMAPRGGRLAEGDNKEESFVREFEHMASPIQTIAFSADGTAVACGVVSGEVRIFKTENGQRLAQIKVGSGPIFALAFTPDGKRIATGGYDGNIRYYDVTNGSPLQDFPSVTIR
jgi:WD40 repeat protein